MEPMNVDGPEQVIDTQRNQVEPSEQFDLSPRDPGVDSELPGGGYEVLLEHLVGDHARPGPAVMLE